MLTAIVIDDEQFAREELTDLLEETGHIQVIASANNAIEGLKIIHHLKPDVIFLDINMPQISGIELIGMLDPELQTRVVFVTAYDQYALKAFEENACDYLLKPVDPLRLSVTIKRLMRSESKTLRQLESLAPVKLEQVPCIGFNRIVIIPTRNIEFAHSDLTGVQVKTASQSATSQLTLKVLEEKTELIRCHRQYLINIKAIHEIKLLEHGLAEILTGSGHTVPVSRRYLKTLKEQIGFY